ncbi:MAG: CHAD domain-containing protein [Pseudomonadales bacterium]|nr:CHAD domain-containing protein [Pseudomonadales bacterium]
MSFSSLTLFSRDARIIEPKDEHSSGLENTEALTETLRNALGHTVRCDEEGVCRYDLAVLDSFALPFFSSSQYCLGLQQQKSQQALFVVERGKANAFHQIACVPWYPVPKRRQVHWPRFSWDIPEGELSTGVAKQCGYWALQERIKFQVVARRYRLLDDQDQVFAFLDLDQVQTEQLSDKLETYNLIRIQTIKGREKAAKGLCKWNQSVALPNPFPTKISKHLCSLQEMEKVPSVSVKGKTPAPQGIKLMLAEAFAGMVLHYDGVLEDIDTEFLHQYRVNLRKARALLKEASSLYDRQTIAEFKPVLKQLGDLSADVRDLDVFLLKIRSWREQYAEEEALLTPLAEKLTEKRICAQKKLFAFLKSQALRDWATGWMAFLQAHVNRDGDPTLQQFAEKKIRKCYTTLIADGRKLDADAPDEAFHELRLDFKRMRYLLEFFAPLFTDRRYTRLVKNVKRLQTVLGDFQDITVQTGKLAFLRDELDETAGQGTLDLLNRIEADMCGSHDELKAAFYTLFQEFDGKASRRVVAALTR